SQATSEFAHPSASRADSAGPASAGRSPGHPIATETAGGTRTARRPGRPPGILLTTTGAAVGYGGPGDGALGGCAIDRGDAGLPVNPLGGAALIAPGRKPTSPCVPPAFQTSPRCQRPWPSPLPASATGRPIMNSTLGWGFWAAPGMATANRSRRSIGTMRLYAQVGAALSTAAARSPCPAPQPHDSPNT